jgi:hypothetical protein
MNKVGFGWHTNKSERAIGCGNSVQILGPIGVDEVNVLLDSQVVKSTDKEVIVMDIDDDSH